MCAKVSNRFLIRMDLYCFSAIKDVQNMNVLAMWIQMDAGRADLFIEFTSLDCICLGDRQSNNYKLVVGVTGKEYVRTYVRAYAHCTIARVSRKSVCCAEGKTFAKPATCHTYRACQGVKDKIQHTLVPGPMGWNQNPWDWNQSRIKRGSFYMVKKSTGAPIDLKTLSLGCGRVLCYVQPCVDYVRTLTHVRTYNTYIRNAWALPRRIILVYNIYCLGVA